MKNLRRTKRFVTLVEMMIVMFLIAMIVGVIAYNYTGSLEEGKAFKTKAGMDKIHTILDLHLATNPDDKDHIDTNWKEIVRKSQLAKSPEELIKDGWGVPYEVSKGDNDEIVIKSQRYETYKRKTDKNTLFGENS